MSADRAALDEALERLSAAARNGNRAKRRLAAKLASMTPAQLRRVPPETFVRLGPDGLRDFAEKSRSMEMRGVAAALPPPPPKPEPLFMRLRRKWHFAHPLLKGGVVMALCAAIGIGAARVSERVVDYYDAFTDERIGGWPKCERLDRGDIDCVYRTSSDELTLKRIAALTHLPAETVAAWNTHLDFHYTLPAGALVIVPRGSARP